VSGGKVRAFCAGQRVEGISELAQVYNEEAEENTTRKGKCAARKRWNQNKNWLASLEKGDKRGGKFKKRGPDDFLVA